jgi:hypothetical protein
MIGPIKDAQETVTGNRGALILVGAARQTRRPHDSKGDCKARQIAHSRSANAR